MRNDPGRPPTIEGPPVIANRQARKTDRQQERYGPVFSGTLAVEEQDQDPDDPEGCDEAEHERRPALAEGPGPVEEQREGEQDGHEGQDPEQGSALAQATGP